MREVNMNMEMTVDLIDAEEFVKSEKFTRFLLDNTTDFSTAGFILTVLLNEIDRLRSLPDEEEKVEF